jgi:hypothetical protein
MTRHSGNFVFVFSAAIALSGCGPSTPEGKVAARAATEFNCSAEEISATSVDAPANRKYKASGCGREAVYVNAAPEGADDNWVLDAPNQ